MELLPYLGQKHHRVAIVGGSFDPAHYGHLYITQQAKRLFRLDKAYWLVTGQNPLKTHKASHSLDDRIAQAQKFIAKFTGDSKGDSQHETKQFTPEPEHHSGNVETHATHSPDTNVAAITVLNLEKQTNSVFSSDILSALTENYPFSEFFWIMGADNLSQITQWHNWQQIFRLATVVVFSRDDVAANCRLSQ
jgi:nicotinate-nucleotide adenylyltransferase